MRVVMCTQIVKNERRSYVRYEVWHNDRLVWDATVPINGTRRSQQLREAMAKQQERRASSLSGEAVA